MVKIEKILQGGIQGSTEPYLKAAKDPKLGMKLNKNVRLYNQKIGRFRMPFAWAARPLFRLYSSELDTAIEFPAIYRQETNRLKDDELLRLLADYRKPDKFSKLTVIPGWLKLTIEPLHESKKSKFGCGNFISKLYLYCQNRIDCLTNTLAPLKPFAMPLSPDGPTIEITEFHGSAEREVHPFTTFINHLFVYPLALNFESQKLFSRARNLAVLVELRDTDAEGAKAIPVCLDWCLYYYNLK